MAATIILEQTSAPSVSMHDPVPLSAGWFKEVTPMEQPPAKWGWEATRGEISPRHRFAFTPLLATQLAHRLNNRLGLQPNDFSQPALMSHGLIIGK